MSVVFVHMHACMHVHVCVVSCVELHGAVVKVLGSQFQSWGFNSHLGALAVVTLSNSLHPNGSSIAT